MKLFIFLLTVSLWVLGAPARAADAKAGKAVYDSKCKTCHGANGEGNAALAKTLKVAIPDLASKEVQGKSDADLQKVVAQGQGKMQAVKGLSDQQAQDVVAFTRSLAKS